MFMDKLRIVGVDYYKDEIYSGKLAIDVANRTVRLILHSVEHAQGKKSVSGWKLPLMRIDFKYQKIDK